MFACEPEWAALVQELGGNTVTASSATTALQDPHQVQARPSLIARLRGADLVVCTGAELEIGWLPILLRQAANPRVQPGTPGYFEAARQVRLLEVPAQLDRAMGDVHAAGNPHIQTDPRNIAAVAAALSARMQQLDPANAAAIAASSAEFHGALGGGDAALGGAGGGAARDADRGLPQELGLSRRLARLARDGHDRAEARCAAGQPVPRAACRRAAGEGRCAALYMPPTKTRAPPNSSHSISACQRSCCLSQSAAASGRPTCSACSTTPLTG